MIRARESKSAPVGVVGKVLRILEALDGSPTGLQLRVISQKTSVNKSTARRISVIVGPRRTAVNGLQAP